MNVGCNRNTSSDMLCTSPLYWTDMHCRVLSS